jgi:hypothetical protein
MKAETCSFCVILIKYFYVIKLCWTVNLYTYFNSLTPNDTYSGRTAPLTFKRCILYIYSTNRGTEYFKNVIYSPFFLFKFSLFNNSNVFGSCIIHVLYTGCVKIKKKLFLTPKA